MRQHGTGGAIHIERLQSPGVVVSFRRPLPLRPQRQRGAAGRSGGKAAAMEIGRG